MSVPVLLIFGNPGILLVSAAVVAVHHIGFFFYLPASLFNYEASFWVVLVHAAFVIYAVFLLIPIALRFKNFVLAQCVVGTELAATTGSLSQSSAQLAQTSRALADSAQEQAAALEESTAAHSRPPDRSTLCNKCVMPGRSDFTSRPGWPTRS